MPFRICSCSHRLSSSSCSPAIRASSSLPSIPKHKGKHNNRLAQLSELNIESFIVSVILFQGEISRMAWCLEMP